MRGRKIIVALLALCLLLSLAPFSSALAADSGARKLAPARATENGTGQTITRAAWISSLVSTFGMTVADENAPDNYYSDMTGNESYYRDILVATSFGIIDVEAGMPFEPEKPATREFAARTLNACLSLQLDAGTAYTFSESSSVNYPDDIQVAINRGWFALQNGKFLPNQAITSAESDKMLADAKGILSDLDIDENYNSIYKYKVGVIEVPDGTMVSTDSNNNIRIENCPVTLKSGDLFVVYFGGIPCAYSAKEVSKENDVTIVKANSIDDGSAFEDIDAQGSVEAEFTQFVPYEGTEVVYINEITQEEFTDPVKAEKSVQAATVLSASSVDIKRSLAIKTTLKLSDAISASVSFTIKNPQIEYDFNLKEMTAMVVLSGKYEASIKAKADFTEAFVKKDIQLGLIGVKGIGGIEFSMVYDLSGSASATYSGYLSFGVAYSRANGFSFPKKFTADSFSLDLEATVKAGFQVSVGLNDIPKDVLAGYYYAEIGAKGKIKRVQYTDENLPKVCVHTAIYLYLEWGSDVTVKFGSFKLNQSFKNEIWHDKNSPIRVVHHYEDGVEVPKCTRDNPEFKNFFTSSSSRWNGGWSGRNGAYGLDANGEPIQIYTYDLDSNGNAIITGYKGNATALEIPESLDGHTTVAIGENAFRGKSQIYSVSIPETVVDIQDYSFYECTNLTKIDLSKKLHTIGRAAFKNCYSLESITIPKSLEKTSTTYPGGPFAGCRSLAVVSFEDGIAKVPDYIFSECSGLKTVVLPNSVLEIGDNAFYDCTKLTNLLLPIKLQKLGESAFENCTSITSVLIPKTLAQAETDYPGGPFEGCSSLSSAEFEDGMTMIPDYLFSGCTGLNTVNFPNSITEIGNDAFYNCNNLENLILPPYIQILGASAFENCTSITSVLIPKTLVEAETDYPGGPFEGCSSLSTVSFEEGTTIVPGHLFSGCNGLVTISFPNSITDIGQHAFYNCTNLTDVTLPAYLKALRTSAFKNCTGINSITIPKTLETVNSDYPGGPFEGCESLTNATLENGMKAVPSDLFSECNGLKQITFPDSITEIGENAFYRCVNLDNVSFPDSIISAGRQAFSGCASLKDIRLPDSLTSIGNGLLSNCSSLTQITLPAGITVIPSEMFKGCSALATYDLPQTVVKISSSAFQDCTSLKSFSWGRDLTTIESNAFRDCDALTVVALPDSVTTLGSQAFYDCDALTTVVLGNGLTSLSSKLFYDCDALTSVTLGSGIKTISDSVFEHCDSLEKIVLPYKVTTIGSNVFKDCVKFKELTIPRATTSIQTNAVSYPDILTIYGVAGTTAESYAKEIGATFVAIDIPVQTITLNQAEVTINRNATIRLIPTITPSDFTDEIVWKSSDTSVATVDADGNVKAVKVGTATISVVGGNVKATCRVTVVQPVTSISLNKTTLRLEAGSSFTLKATVSPSNANNKAIVWTSSDENVATVTQEGVVTALKKGTATITCSAQDGSNVSKTCTVTVPNDLITVADVKDLQSTHPYAANCADVWVYQNAGAESLEVTFSESTSVEDGSDYIYLYDAEGNQIGKYTGSELAGKTITIPGDTVKIKLVSDASYCEYGFAVTNVESTSAEHTHTLTAVAKVNATCTKDGTEAYWKCSSCGKLFGDAQGKNEISAPVVIKATGHKWDSGKVTKEPTENAEGVKTFTCTVCGETRTETIPALGHTHTMTAIPKVNATCTKDGTEAYWKCSGCGKLFSDALGNNEISAPIVIKATGHKWDSGEVTKEPAENAEGIKTFTCTVCGETRTESIPALGHAHTMTAVPKIDATCTKDGTEAYWKCSGCGKLFSDAQGKTEISAPVVIKATGHKWDSGKVTKEPTENSEGVKTFTCTVCGETRTEAIPKLSPKPVSNPFSDVAKDQYYFDPVLWAVNHQPQITNGTSATTFSPDATCTRGQVVTFLWRAKGCPEPKQTNNPFTDVTSDAYYYKAVLWAVEQGITNGTSATTFGPEQSCTRGQVVTFLWRAEGKPSQSGVKNGFTDVHSGQYYYDAVLWAVAQGITNGTSATTFSPDATCTRGQIVTFLYRDMK